MGTQPNSEQETAKREQEALPVSQPVSSPTPVPVVHPPVTPPIQESEVPGEFEQPSDPKPDNSASNPLFISVIRDEKPSPFERKTIFWGRWGVALAGLSFIAACVAAYYVAGQFDQMRKQTCLLQRAAAQAKSDSEAASKATETQLQDLQDQLTEQRQALEMDQRPWLKVDLGGTAVPGSDPSGKTRTLPSFVAGQPMKIPVRVTNIGKTTAEHTKAVLFIQVLSKGQEPVIPRKDIKFASTNGCPHTAKTYPVKGWMDATIYPGQVSENNVSRAGCSPDGEIIDELATPAEVDGTSKGALRVYLVGEVWYSDVFGVPRWTKFCRSSESEASPALLKCFQFESVDNNQPKAKQPHQ